METGAGFYYRQTITALVASAQIPPLKSRRELEAGFPVRELDDQVFVVKSHDLTGIYFNQSSSELEPKCLIYSK